METRSTLEEAPSCPAETENGPADDASAPVDGSGHPEDDAFWLGGDGKMSADDPFFPEDGSCTPAETENGLTEEPRM